MERHPLIGKPSPWTTPFHHLHGVISSHSSTQPILEKTFCHPYTLPGTRRMEERGP
ncbi:hypothetical protein ES332_A11G216000v1 [Gossypium tomentosum]|uniref:Uncharacterized protein n=1 Tax=Gossypium tomentosum TaxID=34277 RepID=A0A5D2NC64_GOSTO|nr:hypothetical protein ES332_A11G216000v1 [Gossypium tomentosum]